jgi:signal transduction histidine kinase
MRGFAKILRYEDLSKEERDEYLDIIISESERLSELATDMLDLSKVENQTIISDKTVYNGSEQIRRAIVLLESSWTEKGIEVCFDCGEIYFYGNEKLLGQVWSNLIDNAIKFSPKNSLITISIIKKPNSVAVQIANPGKNIDSETLERVFDKFYQGDTSHASKGSGIGLAIVKKIVALHKGTVFATSYDTETVFVVELPLAPE